MMESMAGRLVWGPYGAGFEGVGKEEPHELGECEEGRKGMETG